MNIEERIAEILLEVGAVKIQPNSPFTWASGWKSPIYCDNRLTLSFPKERLFIKEQLTALVKQNFSEVEAIAGVATAGIPQGALLADFLSLPFVYVRSKPKAHGMTNLIEGKLEQETKVVVVEDLISTGGSSIKACKALQQGGGKVLGLVAIFSYGFDVATQNFANENIPFFTLSNYTQLVKTAVKNQLIDTHHIDSLEQWRKSPSTWGATEQ